MSELYISKEDAFAIAEKLQNWMKGQEYNKESLLHASVCCDHASRSNFIRAMAEIIYTTSGNMG